VIGTLGRLDSLTKEGKLDALIESGARFADSLMVIRAHGKGETPLIATRRIGSAMVFERLWKETGCRDVIRELLKGRKFGFDVERAIFLVTLHRLCAPGSDRQADFWKHDYRIDGAEKLSLHHLYRAMAWLGEELPMSDQCHATRYSPRCVKDLIEENLFSRRRDLFSSLDLVFFDTTSIYFEGEGGETLGERGHSKDHRPDLKQMVVGAVLDDAGLPICSEMWPGNAADVKSLLPVTDRLRARFGITDMCVVADRGMISAESIEGLERRGMRYILGARMRKQNEVRDEVLGADGEWIEVYPAKHNKKDP
jgi:hypothetical protein